jgi:hypothetical protein
MTLIFIDYARRALGHIFTLHRLRHLLPFLILFATIVVLGYYSAKIRLGLLLLRRRWRVGDRYSLRLRRHRTNPGVPVKGAAQVAKVKPSP